MTIIIRPGTICITGRNQEFDEKELKDANNIESISIDSEMADVNISVSDSSNVAVHFHGQAYVEGDNFFDVHMVDHELKITVKFIGDYYKGHSTLDITIPQKTFSSITVKSSLGNVTLGEGVTTSCIKLENHSGNLESRATFTNAFISTTSGKVKLFTNATENLSAAISTISGDVLLDFNNIDRIIFCTDLIGNGEVRHLQKTGAGHTAYLNVSTKSGEILEG